MKRVFVDPGNFYTKVSVFERTIDGVYEFFGRTFFPSIIAKVQDISGGSRTYEHEGDLYKVGYDCSRLQVDALTHGAYDLLTAMVIVKRIIFDFADPHGEIELCLVLDTPDKIEIYQELARQLAKGPLEVKAYRGFDKRPLSCLQRVSPNLVSVGDGVHEYLSGLKSGFASGMVVDIGHHTSKIYLVTEDEGVELFQIIDFGCSSYYQSIMSQLDERGIHDVNYFWLVKQIELGCQQIELKQGQADVDVSLIIDNVKWDLNKDFLVKVSGILSGYYENRVQWAQTLVITGGGSVLSGELLVHSLLAGGFHFQEIYVEKSPLYALLDAIVDVYDDPSGEQKSTVA